MMSGGGEGCEELDLLNYLSIYPSDIPIPSKPVTLVRSTAFYFRSNPQTLVIQVWNQVKEAVTAY